MNEQDSSSRGCLRCDDYDDIKSELEDLKDQSKEERQGELEQCRESKELLQKKLLKIGIAAVIGGTILGKEFVDKVASYIESFNNVSSVTDNLIGSAVGDPAGDPDIPQDNDEDQDEKNDKPDMGKQPATRVASSSSAVTIPFSPYSNRHPYPLLWQKSEEGLLSEVMTFQGLPYDTPPLADNTILQLMNDFQMADDMFMFNGNPYDYSNEYMAAGYVPSAESMIVPAPGAIGVLLVGSLFGKRRRRR